MAEFFDYKPLPGTENQCLNDYDYLIPIRHCGDTSSLSRPLMMKLQSELPPLPDLL